MGKWETLGAFSKRAQPASFPNTLGQLLVMPDNTPKSTFECINFKCGQILKTMCEVSFPWVWKRQHSLTPYDPIIPTQDLNEKIPPNTAAARLSEGLDLSAPDRVDDQLYNRILWLMLKGDVPAPVAQSHAACMRCNRASDDEPSRLTALKPWNDKNRTKIN